MANYYKEIKKLLIDNEINKRVKYYSINKSDLNTYYSIGKLLIEAQGGEFRAKYGDHLIKEYSRSLTIDLGKGYTTTGLKRMRQFYLIIQKGATMSHQLSYSHYVELLSINDINEINYYILICTNHHFSIRELQNRIKSKEYERLDENTRNKLINN